MKSSPFSDIDKAPADANVHPRSVWQRVAFVVYAAALSVATHWPALQLPEQVPGNDKTTHALAFGMGTGLLWATGWLRGVWPVVFIALGWAALDELTQGLPGLNRDVTWMDMLANVIGVAIAGGALMLMRLRR